ncbi:MAG: SDR family oxidoreductase [Bacteroidota bacterium]
MKNVIVTGASRGLGLKVTQYFLQNGDTVYAINRTLNRDLEKLKEEYRDRLLVISYDLADVEQIHKTIFKETIGLDTPIHALVNNAAIAYDDLVTNIDLQKLETMFKVNVFAPLICSKSAIRQMLLHRVKGSIVHVSSVSVHTGYKGLAMYASTKGALEAFSKNTAREWGERGIRSNCVVAGFMETSMNASLNEEQKDRIYKRTSLKQATSLDSVARTILFLISDFADSITGQSIHVDNGTI